MLEETVEWLPRVLLGLGGLFIVGTFVFFSVIGFIVIFGPYTIVPKTTK